MCLPGKTTPRLELKYQIFKMNLLETLNIRSKLILSKIDLNETKLDVKLEIYRSIRDSCEKLTDILENYQNCLYIYSNELNCLGLLLKEFSKHDKTKAGKIMLMSSKSFNQHSHNMIKLYLPLLRMYQEMETFYLRAVEDSSQTVSQLEDKQTSYKAALLFMKDISENLNPDVYRQMDKFRRVQNQVRNDKRQFDSMKMDVVQKIDLLMASRCNLLNQILGAYQPVLLNILERSDKHYKATEELMMREDTNEYEFKVLKQLNPLVINDTVESAEEAKPEAEPAGEPTEACQQADLLGDDLLLDTSELEEQTNHQGPARESPNGGQDENGACGGESELINLNELDHIDNSSYFNSLKNLQI